MAEPKHEFVHASTYRAAVPGGWLVSVIYTAHNIGGSALCFYPDPDHAWDGSSLEMELVAVR